MSDLSKTLPQGYGMPLVWLYNSEGEELVDEDNLRLSRFIDKFEYVYDEEGDDRCDIDFVFDKVSRLDNPYFQADLVIQVRWGYLVTRGTSEDGMKRSHMRKIAIRDLEPSYSDDGVKLKIKCTDLVAYIRNFKTAIKPRYQNPNAELDIAAVEEAEENFIDFLFDSAEGRFIPTITFKKKAISRDFFGRTQTAEYDEKTGRYQPAIDNARVGREFRLDFYVGKVTRGVEGKGLKNQIDAQLKRLNAQDGSGGAFIQNTTDDQLHIHQRNYNQNIFKQFTYGGGHGELISFDPKTDTRKVKEDSTKTAGVNPFTKKLEEVGISIADTGADKENDTKDGKAKAMDEWYKDARKTFVNNANNVIGQKALRSLKYLEKSKDGGITYKNGEKVYNPIKYEVVKIPSSEVINSPEFQNIIKDKKAEIKAKFRREQTIIGHTLEKVQRKYTASCKVLGDPSLIKSKIYAFYGLSKEDSGRWYAETVKHSIDMKGGYICDLDLRRKPSTIGIGKLSNTATILGDEDDQDITRENFVEDEFIEVFNQTPEDLDNDNSYTPTSNQDFSGDEWMSWLRSGEDFYLADDPSTENRDYYNEPNAKDS